MNASQGTPPSGPRPAEDAGPAALLAALEHAPSALWFLAGPGPRTLWANARARALVPDDTDLPVAGGRGVADVAAAVLDSGRPETLTGVLPGGEAPMTVTLRLLPTGGGPGVVLVAESRDERPDDVAAGPGYAAHDPAGQDAVGEAQLSLLPPSLPLLPDVRLSGSYHPASSVRAAGGDFYDAVSLGHGRLALVIGDAVGHGVPAAAAMSRLRGALRSSALRDPSPASVLAALDDFAAQMDDVQGASVFYAVLDAETGGLTYAAAGHPAPLLVHADGTTVYLPVTARPPLGTLRGAPNPVARADLEPGATLVLYSDGAVAASGPPPAQGISRLTEVARAALAEPAVLDGEAMAGLAGTIAEGLLTDGGRPDDIAVLVTHRLAHSVQPLQLDLLAVPASLPAVRRRLSAWLTALGMGEEDRVGVMVAVGEACANAAEHAYRDTEPGPVQVTAAVDVDGVLTVTVRDEGTWRPPDRDPGDRGRGLLIMRQLVDGMVVQGEHGTTVTLRTRLRQSPDEEPEHLAAGTGVAVVVDRTGSSPVVRAAGEVDMVSAEQLRIRLLEASHGGTVRVELDLTAVTLFSSAAVRVVLAVAAIAEAEGWRLVVHAPVGGVTRHILQVSGLERLVELR
ncbi:anti-anti-sigma factor [Geodermatophilus bullaregiensis]|uniref:SpoIIE family protein phosphatase n=1 Tax=Geodermatophilus bullaregiensis TaxID=1564160 RepID=UPI00195A7590|nr:SpoIIE family protein phosphatase [Geodermatophilus bullaregiensis]MBM7808681.1 anti-anti-sigma factor [Geodermatophilus bullaregiensis]